MNAIAKLVGFRFSERRYARFSWAEFSARGWGLGLTLFCYDDHWSIGILPVFGSIYFRIWSAPGATLGDDISYGFSWRWGREWGNGDGIHLNWGSRCKILHMPWGWVWQRRSLLAEDGRSWVSELKSVPARRFPNAVPVAYPPSSKRWFFLQDIPHWNVALPYRYTLRSGEQQNVQATISVEEMEWRMRALQWLPWPRLVCRSIDVKFDAEVGERSGSWKGGCTGCSYEMRHDETPQECLRRMVEERKFT